MSDPNAFTPEDREAVYKAIFTRRDVRGEFLPDPVDDATLTRLLTAAHHAPSVGFMQPWDFLVIRDVATRQKVHGLFTKANDEACAQFPEDRRATYQSLKLQGILDAPVNLCITCDRDRGGPVVLGRTHQPEMDLYSTVCAVQNLWLAARAEGLGVGWVSILDPEALKTVLEIPEKLTVIAYLCIGWVSAFHDMPDLERKGWRERMGLEGVVHWEGW
ncbi:5,6-dimethylbenzimidazole synthase [Magnetospira sp. QH-2]|uniref:5,6-dimethylbenzimidazole synthase n=1 Tax=Magnetospira sp. (strain QH-2) TaxID=1288970 RepID=UPI0003E81B81|nr:5,6-dimethylbenzimidazole synthase [Magnetospira sp. QH-2]CCQ73949.1 Cob(II)yrinic acid a,c-diamide reductase [Magnetospira sp. QH-2]